MDRNNIPLATLILDHNRSLDDCQEVGDALISAAGNGSMKMLDLLLDRGAPVDAKGRDRTAPVDAKPIRRLTSLYAAVNAKEFDVVKKLLSLGADVSACEGVLQRAALTGNTEIAGLLLDNGADVNNEGNLENQPECTRQELRQRRLNPSAWHPDCLRLPTPLELAATHWKWDMAKFLVARGADPTIVRECAKNWVDKALKE